MIWLYLRDNKEWILSGIGIAVISLIIRLISNIHKLFINRWILRKTPDKYFLSTYKFPIYKYYLTDNKNINKPSDVFTKKCAIKSHSKLLKKLKKDLGYSALIWIDIDKFTQINNLYGKEYGDIIVDIILKILFAISQKYNYEVYHALNRDEFFIIIPSGLGVRDCAIESISLIEQYNWSEIVPNMFVTCSAGIATCNVNPIDTIKKARVSLNLIKSKGGNGVGPEIRKLHPYELVNINGS